MASFPPIIGSQPTILILGSMPSQISLAEQRYYANPANAFWWLMAQLIGFPLDLTYTQRSQCLTNAGYAIWDVLQDCEREGSLDSNIVRASEQPNDIEALLSDNPSVKKIGFNGRAAQTIFKRHNKLASRTLPLRQCLLPSTSPAHASMTKQQKLQAWCTALQVSPSSEIKATDMRDIE